MATQMPLRMLALALAVAAAAPAQTKGPEAASATAPDPAAVQRALEWTMVLGARYRELHNPVAAAYGIASVAALICPVDRTAGPALFQDALNRLNLLPGNAFEETKQLLPVSSFARLVKFVMPAAVKCDPALAQYLAKDKVQARLNDERQKANDNLSTALGDIETNVSANPDRDAQLADAALAAGDPNTLDMPTLVKFMAELRERAPDLTDELLPAALDFITSAPAPNPSLLAELGNYLFVSYKEYQSADKDDKEETVQAGSQTVPKLEVARQSTNTDDVKAYIEAAVKVLAVSQDPNYDPVAAYALTLQLLAQAPDNDPDQVDTLTKLSAELASQLGSSAATVQAAVGNPQGLNTNSGEAAAARLGMAARVLRAGAAGRFLEARQMLPQVDGVTTRSQISGLLDFAEAGRAIGLRNVDRAWPLVNTLRGGVKRSLLYSGLVAASSRASALDAFGLAMKDADSLPAEQRIATLSALAAATFQVDTDSALLALKEAVKSANDATVSPRRGMFDPKSVGPSFKASKADIGTDSALIVIGTGSGYEVVETGHGRHSFQLQVPGVQALNIAAAVKSAKDMDPERIAALLMGLRDETRLVKAMNALAELRLKPGN